MYLIASVGWGGVRADRGMGYGGVRGPRGRGVGGLVVGNGGPVVGFGEMEICGQRWAQWGRKGVQGWCGVGAGLLG